MLAATTGQGVTGEGCWRVADRQSAGRGRAGRVWRDGYGNFMGSTPVRLRDGDPPPHSLGLLAGVAVHAAIEEVLAAGDGVHTPALHIKWPNDLLLGGRKVAGILAERVQDTVVIGVGVNLCSAPQIDGRETIGLADVGLSIGRDDFARQLARQFADWLARWRGGEWPIRILAAWMMRAHPVGTLLTISEGPYAGLTGTFECLDGNGALLLRLPDGRQHAIYAGDVQQASEDDIARMKGAGHVVGH